MENTGCTGLLCSLWREHGIEGVADWWRLTCLYVWDHFVTWFYSHDFQLRKKNNYIRANCTSSDSYSLLVVHMTFSNNSFNTLWNTTWKYEMNVVRRLVQLSGSCQRPERSDKVTVWLFFTVSGKCINHLTHRSEQRAFLFSCHVFILALLSHQSVRPLTLGRTSWICSQIVIMNTVSLMALLSGQAKEDIS